LGGDLGGDLGSILKVNFKTLSVFSFTSF
jgi:hypothetical protein